MSKFTPDHHRSRSKKSGAGSGGAGGRDLSTLQAAMMASESKVADWLAQNDPTMIRSESTEEDSKSIKSDVPVHLKRLKGGGCFYIYIHIYIFKFMSWFPPFFLLLPFSLLHKIYGGWLFNQNHHHNCVRLQYYIVLLNTISALYLRLSVPCVLVDSLFGAEDVGSGNQAGGLAASRQKHLNPNLLLYCSDSQ